MYQWKNFENRSVFVKVTAKDKVWRFFRHSVETKIKDAVCCIFYRMTLCSSASFQRSACQNLRLAVSSNWSVNYSVSQRNPAEVFWHFPQTIGIFLVHIISAYYSFLSTLEYKFLFNYLQMWQSYAILSATAQFRACSKCPQSAETHAGRSHLILHNFVAVGDNWIKKL